MKLVTLHEDAKRISKQLIGRFGNISIYCVDGEQVRSMSSALEEFNESASHLILDEIPKNEGWIENNVADDEMPFIIHGLLVGIRAGNYNAGELAEKAERSKTQLSQYGKSGKPDPGTYARKLGSLFGVIFYLIDAEIIRDQYKTDFALGGNHGPYSWVPRNEIWLDETIHPSELPFIALHEFYERIKMLRDRWTYNRAHAAASAIEWRAKENKKLPQRYIQLMQFIRDMVRI